MRITEYLTLTAGAIGLATILAGCSSVPNPDSIDQKVKNAPRTEQVARPQPVTHQAPNPKPKHSKKTIEELIRKGNAAYQRDDYATAAEHFQTAIKRGKTDDADIFFKHGYSLIRQDKFDEAKSQYEAGVKVGGKPIRFPPMYKKKAQDLYGKGWSLYRGKNYTAALDNFQKAWKEENNSVTGTQIGHCYKKMGDKRNAKDWYTQALKVAPNDITALGSLARLAYEAKDKKRGIGLCELYLAFDPTSKHASKYKTRIKELKAL